MTAATLILVGFAVLLLVALTARRARDGALLGQQLTELRGRVEALTAAQQQVPLELADGRAAELETLGDLRERLGALTAATRRLEDVGAQVAAVQELLAVPKLRGTLGEVWLEELLRQVFPPACFEMQYAFLSGERVDAVLRVGAHLVPVDAKFPLEAFLRMHEAEGEAVERERRAFRRSLKGRIDEIAARYIRPAEGTFDFALMYVPAEAVYYEAIVRGELLTEEASLSAYALRKKVILVSPHTFYAYLAAVLHGLRGLEVEERAREILDGLGGIQLGLERFGRSYELVRTHLERASKQYADSERQMQRVREQIGALTEVEGAGEAALVPRGGERSSAG